MAKAKSNVAYLPRMHEERTQTAAQSKGARRQTPAVQITMEK